MLIKSHAKINLFLEILGKNKKNYHELESLIAFLDIFDEIKINKSNKLSLKFFGKYADFLNNDSQENIILKTIKFMSEEFNFEPNLEINLTKNIPIQAGLGGGSANSASIILALNKIYNLKLNKETLIKIGLKMGCDVPICLNNKMALIKGIGEKLIDVNLKNENLFVVVINPNQHLSTARIFNNLEIKENLKQEIKENHNIIETIKNRKNDLEKTAIKYAPKIAEILSEIKKQENCLISRMSGSGSTCFGLFYKESEAKNATENLTKRYPDFYIKTSKLIYKKQIDSIKNMM